MNNKHNEIINFNHNKETIFQNKRIKKLDSSQKKKENCIILIIMQTYFKTRHISKILNIILPKDKKHSSFQNLPF
jgi:hypothetical protein